MRGFKSVLVAIALVPNLAATYQIDASCTKAGLEDVVRTAMGSAIEMAESAHSRLRATTWDAYTTKLVGMLFAKDGQTLGHREMSKAESIYRKNFSFYKTEKTSATLLPNDVIIYCDDSRMRRVSRYPRLYEDTVSGEVVQYDNRPCHGTFGDWIALAVTRNPGKDDMIGNINGPRNLPTQIQLCEWFVDWIKRKEIKTTKDLALKSRVASGFIKGSDKNRIFAQIDAESLLDKVLLHEMTHGWIAYNWVWTALGDTETTYGVVDVPSTGKFGLIPILGRLPSYGWKLCRSLAQNGQAVVGQTNANYGAPDNNADTLALFASGMYNSKSSVSSLVKLDRTQKEA
ncbi:hypothetical protein P154DRAFT_569877 [Amniculicola lignicola CBS 123094]|uniref:Lysine-specific metallo-endopeptidase domain-containing protein n=1 Tax=Amniculicola lignicola CBS 123094 TaxID=1392246 RepID=A0A6A5WZT4_9PLEO|nr:hypothetical protein P154DRAFT_569877 [Amniculicola lignicola CBS 123094]